MKKHELEALIDLTNTQRIDGEFIPRFEKDIPIQSGRGNNRINKILYLTTIRDELKSVLIPKLKLINMWIKVKKAEYEEMVCFNEYLDVKTEMAPLKKLN